MLDLADASDSSCHLQFSVVSFFVLLRPFSPPPSYLQVPFFEGTPIRSEPKSQQPLTEKDPKILLLAAGGADGLQQNSGESQGF